MGGEQEEVATRGDVVADVSHEHAGQLREHAPFQAWIARHAELDALFGHGRLHDCGRRRPRSVPSRDAPLQREVGGDERGGDGQPAMRSPAAICSTKICSIVAPSAWRAI